MYRSKLTNILKIKRVLILADESSFCKIGGLFQLDRLLLNCIETLSFKNEPQHLQFFIFWKRGVKKKEAHFFNHPALKDIHAIMDDDPSSLKEWLCLSEGPVIAIRTNLLLGRRALTDIINGLSLKDDPLRIISSPYIVIFKDVSALKVAKEDDMLWERLCSGFKTQADKGKAEEPYGFYENITDPSEIVPCEKRLFKSLSKPTDGLVSTYLNRPISLSVSRFLATTPITPNQWTIMLLPVMLAGVWALTWGSYTGFIIGTFIYQMVSILDGCDGELARVRFAESKHGEWIDTVSDLSGNILFLFALGIGLSKQRSIEPSMGRYILWEGTLCAAAMIFTLWRVHSFTKKREASGHFNNFGRTIIQELNLPGWSHDISLFIAKILKRDTYILIFFIMSLFNRTEWILHAMAIGITVHLFVLFCHPLTAIPKFMYKNFKALSRAQK